MRFSVKQLLRATTLLAAAIALLAAASWPLKLLGFPTIGAAAFAIFGKPWRGALAGIALPIIFVAAAGALWLSMNNPRAAVIYLLALAVPTAVFVAIFQEAA